MGVSPNLGPIDEVIVLVKEQSGRRHAWRVFDATATFLTGPLRHGRTTATITASGVFHRLSKMEGQQALGASRQESDELNPG